MAVLIALVPTLALALHKALDRPSPRDIAERFRRASAGSASEPTSEPPVFRDVSAESGLDFVHDNGARGECLIPEQVGPGVGLFDCDGDTDLDVFVAAGGALLGDGPRLTCRLFRNQRGRFVDATESSGALVPHPAYGVTCADYDGDGDVDVYVTRLGPNVLLQNDGSGRFSDVTAHAGVGDPGFGTSAAFFDFDRDGWLDLYVCNYVDWTPALERVCQSNSGVRDYCEPRIYDAPGQGRLYHNLANGRFEDVTTRAGMQGHRGLGLGVVACDFDDDGWPDLYVANDTTPAMLWCNRGDGTFEDRALMRGCAYNHLGIAIAGMGVACEDLDDDGRADLLVTNIGGQAHLALLNRGASFSDESRRLGLEQWSLPATGFGAVVFDQDLDGAWDAYIANGAVNLATASPANAHPYAQADHFVRQFDGRFVDRSMGAGVALETGRGLAAGDLDGDGDLDLVVANNGGRLRQLENLQSTGHAWLIVDARVRRGASAAIGARVSVSCGGRTQRREIRAQSSYLSSSDPRAHFGLGQATAVDELVVGWLDGTRTVRRNVAVNQVLVIDRDEAAAVDAEQKR